MKTPPRPKNEVQRQQALDQTGLLNNDSDSRFDRITRLARDLFCVPIALVSLIDNNRQWFKSRQGLDASETPREISFCGHAILSSEPLIIENALGDERFCDNPLVKNAPDIRFYAGVPLHTTDGYRLGTLCLIDNKPRSFSNTDIEKLKDLGSMVEDLIQADIARRNEYGNLETSLNDVQKRMQLVVQGMNLGTWQYNVQNGETIFNERWAEMLGYTLEELEPTSIETFGNLTHPEDSDRVEMALKEHFAGKVKDYSVKFRMRHKQQYWKWILSQGQVLEWSEEGDPILMYGAHVDIDNEVTADNLLKKSEARLRGLFDFSPIGIALNDFETGQFLDLNAALIAPTGYTHEEFVNLSYWDLTPKEYEPEEQKALASLQETGGYGPFEKEYIRKDGTRYPIRLQGMLSQELDGTKVIWSLVEDITESKKIDKMKDEFIATVSHELRTPLTAIRGALGLMSGGVTGELPEKTKKLLSTAERNTARLMLLINDLLDMEKLVAGKMTMDSKSQPIGPILNEAIESVDDYLHERKVLLQTPKHWPAVNVYADGPRLTQALANLLSNAIKFSPEEKQVEISVRKMKESIEICIRDHGPGVAKEFQKQLFQRFSREDSSDNRKLPGTGLGLAITHEICQQMGGKVGYRDTKGGGSIFFIQLRIGES